MIITDENSLRVDCVDVLPDEVNILRDKLEKALEWSGKRGFPGIGLAAPQIGIAKKMAIVRVGNKKVDLVNCKIVERYDEFIFTGEGCLSFPGRFETTKRFREILVDSNLVAPHRFIATDLLAVAIEHELDHLEKRLLPDMAISKLDKNIAGSASLG